MLKYIFFFLILYINATANEPHIIRENDKYIGKRGAKVIFVEYASLSCAACAHFHNNILPKIRANYIDSGEVVYILRDFPNNKPAMIAAVFANCFSNEYFSIVDILMESQNKWIFRSNLENIMKNIAKLSGYDPEKLDTCLKNKDLYDRILHNVHNDIKKFSIAHVPTFFINGKKVHNIDQYENFANLFDKTIKQDILPHHR